MGNKALKIFYAAFMAIILVSLVVFMVIHVRAGLDGQYAKILLAGYVLLILWAAFRIFNLVKSIKIDSIAALTRSVYFRWILSIVAVILFIAYFVSALMIL